MRETLHNYYGTKQVEKIFLINAPIVNVIVEEMLCNPDDIEGKAHANMMACFEDVADYTEDLSGGEGLDRYRVVIKNQLRFFLGVDYLRVRLSFHQASRVLLTTKECIRS